MTLIDDSAFFKENGFLLKKQLLDISLINVLKYEIEQILERNNLKVKLLTDEDASLKSFSNSNDIIVELQKIREFHTLSNSDAIKGVISQLLSIHTEEILLHPRKFFRICYPTYIDNSSSTGLHQDFRYVQGSVDTITTWIPLSNYSRTNGVLKIFPRTHKHGLYPIHNDKDSNLNYVIDLDESQSQNFITNYEAGDIVFFHSLMVHGSTPNVSNVLRLSVDFRYQSNQDEFCQASLFAPYICNSNVPDDNPTKWSFDPNILGFDNLKLSEWKKFNEELKPGISRFI